jgi:hypothetical protein
MSPPRLPRLSRNLNRNLKRNLNRNLSRCQSNLNSNLNRKSCCQNRRKSRCLNSRKRNWTSRNQLQEGPHRPNTQQHSIGIQ